MNFHEEMMKIMNSIINRMSKSVIIGCIILIISTSSYYFSQEQIVYFSSDKIGSYNNLAYIYYMFFVLGIVVTSIGVLRLLRKSKTGVNKLNEIPVNCNSLIPYIFTIKRNVNIFLLSTIGYGLFYSYVTSMIIYQPSLKFSEIYGSEIPSIVTILCCGPPGQTPILIIYFTENFGMLLIPLSILLLIIVSILVGLNLTLASFTYRAYSKSSGKWFGGFGATIGLFTGCPTCAGLFLASMIGGTSAVGVATILASYQSIFIGVSIPILIATPFIIINRLSKALNGICIVPN